MTDIEYAYANYSTGSQGFCQFIESRAGMGLSHLEVKRIASVAPNASSFMRIWQDLDWWEDKESDL